MQVHVSRSNSCQHFEIVYKVYFHFETHESLITALRQCSQAIASHNYLSNDNHTPMYLQIYMLPLISKAFTFESLFKQKHLFPIKLHMPLQIIICLLRRNDPSYTISMFPIIKKK